MRWVCNTLEVQALFRGQLIATHHLDEPGGAGKRTRPAQYVIGATANANAPVAQEVIGGASLPLVTTWGEDYLVNVTPQMGGALWVDGRAVQLQDYVRERGRSFTLPPRSRVRLDCGQVVFVLGRTCKAERVPRPWLALRWTEHKYTAAAAMLLGLFLLAMFVIPPDARSLSLESWQWDKNYLRTLTTPPVERQVPDWLTAKRPDQRGDEGNAHAGDPGKMGSKKSSAVNQRYAIRGPANNRDPYMSKQAAEERARNSGVLGILDQHGSNMASIFGRQTALGNDPEDALGQPDRRADRRRRRPRWLGSARNRPGRGRDRREHAGDRQFQHHRIGRARFGRPQRIWQAGRPAYPRPARHSSRGRFWGTHRARLTRSVLRIGHLAPFASLRSPGAKRGSTRTIVYDLLRA